MTPEPPSAAALEAILPRALNSTQERRLTDYLDEKILEIQREYRKRNYETSSLRTLSAYIRAVHPLLTLILMIPPVNASVHLRASLLLRLTGELLDCIPGYTPAVQEIAELLNTLEGLDHGWLAVLRSQSWNAVSKEGVDLVSSVDIGVRPASISQTDRTRLRSLLLSGTDKLEQWLEDHVPSAEKSEANDISGMLEVRQRFDDLFHETLAEMGELRGTFQ